MIKLVASAVALFLVLIGTYLLITLVIAGAAGGDEGIGWAALVFVPFILIIYGLARVIYKKFAR